MEIKDRKGGTCPLGIIERVGCLGRVYVTVHVHLGLLVLSVL